MFHERIPRITEIAIVGILKRLNKGCITPILRNVIEGKQFAGTLGKLYVVARIMLLDPPISFTTNVLNVETYLHIFFYK